MVSDFGFSPPGFRFGGMPQLRPITSKVRRRAWGELGVRPWTFLTLLLLAVAVFMAIGSYRAWRGEARLIRVGVPTEAEVVAFSDANATWAPDALRKLVRNLADPKVAYVCGRLQLEAVGGGNQEGVYWRYELLTRASESRLGSVTGGNGSIYAVRRADYVEVDSRFGHDLSLPYALVQRGRRAVYDPEALAFEKATPTNETEYRRKVRMFEHCWLIVLTGKMLHRLPPLYALQIVSHRLLRYGSGILHVVLLVTSILLATHGSIYLAVLAVQVASDACGV